MIQWLRRNIGTIIAFLGFVLLSIVTFGDLGELLTEEYWRNVGNNLTSIGFVSLALTFIQVSVKQGLAEQALQKGMNTKETIDAYMKHRDIVNRNVERMLYLPYFLQSYNKRMTQLKKREFLIDNNFTSEDGLYENGTRRQIWRYESIIVQITAASIKWCSSDVVYNKLGQIISLQEYRQRRVVRGVIFGLFFMVGTAFLTKGLFFDPAEDVPIWQKFVQLLSYAVVIAITSILPMIKEYDKGAHGIPHELDEINEIWVEFENWEVPTWVKDEISEEEEIEDEQETEGSDVGTDLPAEQEEGEGVQLTLADHLVYFPGIKPAVPDPYAEEQSRQRA